MNDFEYHILIEDDKQYLYPASAPQIECAVTLLKREI